MLSIQIDQIKLRAKIVSGDNEIKKGSDATGSVDNEHEVESSAGEAKPETSDKIKKYDVFVVRVIIAVFSVFVAFFASFIMAGFVFKGLLNASDGIAISIAIVVTLALFYTAWKRLSAPSIKKSKVMKLWLDFKYWISTLGDDA